MKEISFEIATELGLIPRPKHRYLTFSFPFESRYAYEKRCEAGEISFRSEMAKIRDDFKIVNYHGEQLKVI